MSYLVLVRHGESEWNSKDLWTGWTDISLSEKGRQEAREAALALKDIRFDIAYTSSLARAQQTLDEMIKTLNIPNIPIMKNKALDERNYGVFTGKNKWDIKEKLGDEEFLKLRRSWDYPITKGESLKQVYLRVIPYYETEILPKLKIGKNILISAHGNSIRALAKYLENISDDYIAKFEIDTGETLVYQIDQNGKVISKEVRVVHKEKDKP